MTEDVREHLLKLIADHDVAVSANPLVPVSAEPPRKIMIALPAYTGVVHVATMRSLLIDILGMAEKGWMVDLREIMGCADIAHARSDLVSLFLAGDATDLVLIDWDIAWEPDTLVKLCQYPVDFVAGVYRNRADPEGYCVRWLNERPHLVADPATGLLEVEAVPAGFLRITRNCARTMIEGYPDLVYPQNESTPVYGLFEKLWQDGFRYGEDISFCLRWRAIGGKVWIDPMMRLHHIGYKTFTGSLGEWLRKRPFSSAA